MNNKRRDLLKNAVVLLEQASAVVERALDEEQDCFDNISENLHMTDRYESIEAAD